MARTRMENRIVKAGIRLCKERVARSGAMITADDLRQMKVKTFSPWTQGFYIAVGVAFVVSGIWIQSVLKNMAIALTPALIGIGNICYAQWGRPAKVSELVPEETIRRLSGDIVQEFVAQMDRKLRK